ncbi:ankyrin repeat domain-containing protein 26-like, partial [Artibeus jamaicensis]|uniref:ankyrin repeat domain-containing protein 26-like n=1 Tax=Artibeus jamaicensis TaxID=9417 RepID=UPI00235A5161
MSGSRNFKMAKVEDTGNGGTPVAHIDSPGKYSHLKPTVEEKGPIPEKAAGMNFLQTSRSELDLEVTPEEEQERLNGSENNHPQVEEEEKMHNSSEVAVIENVHNADADDSNGLIQQRKREQTDKQPFPVIGSEYSDRSTEKTSYEEKTFSDENKVKQKFNSMDDLDDLTQSSETFSEHCELPYSNCKNFMLLIEQLGMDCK